MSYLKYQKNFYMSKEMVLCQYFRYRCHQICVVNMVCIRVNRLSLVDNFMSIARSQEEKYNELSIL